MRAHFEYLLANVDEMVKHECIGIEQKLSIHKQGSLNDVGGGICHSLVGFLQYIGQDWRSWISVMVDHDHQTL